MKTQLIILEQGNIIVSNEEIKELNWCLDEERNIIFQFKHFNSGILHSDNHSQFESKCQKIIAGLENQPTIDYSSLSDEDCKKIGYIDVEKLAKEYLFNDYQKQFSIDSNDEQFGVLKGYIEGFKKAQSLNDNKFSLEDIKKALDYGYDISDNLIDWNGGESHYNDFIQSLQQPKVFQIKVEMETCSLNINDLDCHEIVERLKITNNSIKLIKILK